MGVDSPPRVHCSMALPVATWRYYKVLGQPSSQSCSTDAMYPRVCEDFHQQRVLVQVRVSPLGQETTVCTFCSIDSEVTVVIETADCKSASLQLEQRIYDSHQQLLSQAEISIVCVATHKDEKGQTQVHPTRLPKAFVQLLQLAR